MSDDAKKMLKRIGDKIKAETIGPTTQDYVNTYLLNAIQTVHAKKPRTDALAKVIKDIAIARPEITDSELRTELEGRKGLGVPDELPGAILDFDDDEIHFIGNNGQSESAPISGLKNRLSRAKKKLKSR